MLTEFRNRLKNYKTLYRSEYWTQGQADCTDSNLREALVQSPQREPCWCGHVAMLMWSTVNESIWPGLRTHSRLKGVVPSNKMKMRTFGCHPYSCPEQISSPEKDNHQLQFAMNA